MRNNYSKIISCNKILQKIIEIKTIKIIILLKIRDFFVNFRTKKWIKCKRYKFIDTKYTMKIILIFLILINFNNIKCIIHNEKIINKQYVQDDEAHFFVGITDSRGSPFCGGTLFKPDKVLTAANCFNNKSIDHHKNIYIKYGTKLIHDQIFLVQISRIILHPDFDPHEIPARTRGDIAVITLSRAIDRNPMVEKATLQDQPLEIGEKVTLYGWGLMNVDPPQWNKRLMKGEFTFIQRGDKKLYCLALDKSGCNGDSGGPLVSSDGKVSGVLSFFSGRCQPGSSNTYAEVSAYYNWIHSQ